MINRRGGQPQQTQNGMNGSSNISSGSKSSSAGAMNGGFRASQNGNACSSTANCYVHHNGVNGSFASAARMNVHTTTTTLRKKKVSKAGQMKRRKGRYSFSSLYDVDRHEHAILYALLVCLAILLYVLHVLSGDESVFGQEFSFIDNEAEDLPNARKYRNPFDPFGMNWRNRERREGDEKNKEPPYIGDRSPEYRKLREEFKEILLPKNEHEKRLEYVKTLRKRRYHPIQDSSSKPPLVDVFNCPEIPPPRYPQAWKILDIVNNWNPDDTTPHESIYQGICIFDFNNPEDYKKAINYREAEVPFVLRDDPLVLRTVERWNHPDYLTKLLGDEFKYRAEFSHNNHFMYWMLPQGGTKRRRNNSRNPVKTNRKIPPGWNKPTEMIRMLFSEWLSKAKAADQELEDKSDDHKVDTTNQDHWYFRLIGCGLAKNCDKNPQEFLFDELPFFRPDRDTFYLVDPKEQRGIHCRFGMKGVIAENHFDGSRNSIVILGGERRYILSHPKECPNLALLPKEHPSGRHSAVDWSNPDLEGYPQFEKARGNEVVLQAGDVLYLPTFWFHYIVSLEMNYQCNTRSGISGEYKEHINDCGF